MYIYLVIEHTSSDDDTTSAHLDLNYQSPKEKRCKGKYINMRHWNLLQLSSYSIIM